MITILNTKDNSYSNNMVSSYYDDNDAIVSLNAYTLNLVGDKNSILLINTKLRGITIAVDKYVISKLQNIHRVVFKFVNTQRDTPPIYADEDLEFEITNILQMIDIYAEYLRYKLVDVLPYEDFAVDHIPEIHSVLINGVPSNLFDELNSHMDSILSDCKQIDIHTNYNYKMNDKYILCNDQKTRYTYIRLNPYSSLFHYIATYTYEKILKMTSFEITFSWFPKTLLNRNVTLDDSSFDDHVYSYIEVNDFLTLSALFDLIIACYKKDMKDYLNTHILINVFRLTFRDNNRVCEKLVPIYDGKLPYINILDHIIMII